MPQSLSLVIVHLVFSTKERFPYLQGNSRAGMFGYLARLCQDLGCHCYQIGGMADHAHVSATMPRTVSQAELVEFLKTRSSKWFKVEGQGQFAKKFAWQRGYAAFSVSQSRIDSVIRYIQNQEKHHKRISFQEEYRRLLTRHGIDFDEKYVWD